MSIVVLRCRWTVWTRQGPPQCIGQLMVVTWRVYRLSWISQSVRSTFRYISNLVVYAVHVVFCCIFYLSIEKKKFLDLFNIINPARQYLSLTLSPPAVKTQWLSQCQAFQRLVRSSNSLVNWTFDLLNQLSISLACFWKHWMLFASVCNVNTLGQ
jgi:hypothetical protein